MKANFPTLFGCNQGVGGKVVCVGAAYDRGSSVDHGGAASGPRVLRQASAPEILQVHKAGLFDLGRRTQIFGPDVLSDIGDIKLRTNQTESEYHEILAQAVSLIVKEDKRPLLLGGDHSVTLFALRGFAKAGKRVQVLQLDAHHDFEELSEGERPTHSSVVAHLIREDLVEKVIQLGIRGLSWGVPALPDRISSIGIEELSDALLPGIPIYLSVDVDAFDPARLGAIHFPEPGGLNLDDFDAIMSILRLADVPLVGADWTEYVPRLDTPNLISGRVVLRGIAKTIQVLGAVE